MSQSGPKSDHPTTPLALLFGARLGPLAGRCVVYEGDIYLRTVQTGRSAVGASATRLGTVSGVIEAQKLAANGRAERRVERS